MRGGKFTKDNVSKKMPFPASVCTDVRNGISLIKISFTFQLEPYIVSYNTQFHISIFSGFRSP